MLTADEILALMEEAHRTELRERQKFYMAHGAALEQARRNARSGER
jgi:hypothetical protein